MNSVSSRTIWARFWCLICFVAMGVGIQAGPWVALIGLTTYANPAYAKPADNNDWDGDGDVDLDDLMLFSEAELQMAWQDVDWCLWLEGQNRNKKQFGELYQFIEEYFQCGQVVEDPLAIQNANNYPTRLALGADGKIFVSDAKVGSVFIYDNVTDRNIIGELKDLGTPLGVAVGPLGNIYVGSDGRNTVEVFDSAGKSVGTIGQGTIQMPNGLAFDQSGMLYVVDSRANAVLKFDPSTGALLGSIGAGELAFPVGLTIAPGQVAPEELYVADQGNFRVRVYDLQGNLLRSLGSKVSQGSLGYKWKGRFIRLQGVAIDGSGRVHALDSHMSKIQILNAANGAYISDYGTEGTDPGQLGLPLDLVIGITGEAIVADGGNRRLEVIPIP